jgi:6-phosphofructokinase 1
MSRDKCTRRAMSEHRLGILVGGGPAPGINSALSAAAIGAIEGGLEVIGIYDGFSHLIAGRTDMVRRLDIADVSRIHAQGGSIIRTSRANPTKAAEHLQRTVDTLKALDLSYLVTIGGDDTASAAAQVAQHSGGGIRFAHIPKTIDNDLPLPGGAPTFGFETARQLGTELVLNLMEESRSTNRWCIAVVMGRKAGHLALGIGKAAGATITIIPEEFSKDEISLDDVCLALEASMLKRRAMGRADGVAVVAEGVAAKMDPDRLASMPGVEVRYDAHDNIRLEKIPLEAIIEREIVRRFAERGETITVVPVTLGYLLRCAAPIPFDIDYTRTLGFGAVDFLLSEDPVDLARSGGLVCLDAGQLRVVPFEEIQDPQTGKIRTRMVDVHSEYYKVAREYMIRLQRRDLHDRELLPKLASAARMDERRFVETYAPVLDADVMEGVGAR